MRLPDQARITLELPSGLSQETKKSLVHNFLDLNEKERDDLRQFIKESGGLVRIMVHPYFARQQLPENYALRDHPNEVENTGKQRIDIVEKGFERLLQAKRKVPTLIFEDNREVEETAKYLQPILEESKTEIYIVSTDNNDPTPCIAGLKPDQSWEELIKELRVLGVKKCVIGGMYLKSTYPSDPNPKGCATETIYRLRPHFEVQISSLGHPHSRRDFPKLDKDSKPEDFEESTQEEEDLLADLGF